MYERELSIGEVLTLAPDIRLMVIRIRGNEVHLRIDAPADIEITVCARATENDAHDLQG